jgi:hypothetical protein
VGSLQGHDDAPYVSTGHLPSPEQVRRLVDEADERYRMVARGRALAGVPGAGRRACRAVRDLRGRDQTSGDWLYDVGVPGKSGIGGGIVVVSPGKGGLGTFAPPLDAFGNSVKGQLAARFLSRRLGLSLFVSEPEA